MIGEGFIEVEQDVGHHPVAQQDQHHRAHEFAEAKFFHGLFLPQPIE